MIADVLLPLALAGAYSYLVPDGMAVAAGNYVEVPLGPRAMIGVVWGLKDTPPEGMKLRAISQTLDAPVMTELHRKFIDWVAAYYLEPKGNVLRMALRAPGALAGAASQIACRATATPPPKLTPQRARVLDIAREGMPLRIADLAELAGVGSSVVKGLIKQGALEAVALPLAKPFAAPALNAGKLPLSTGQEAAARALRAVVAARSAGVTLLDGVTGSGKTEVYFEAMAAALASGAQVFLLLPEIALTQQFLARVERRFGVEPAHWHSEVRPRERERVWRGVADGTARIVVGARSALFLPWARLGLVIVDEEHESAYKQEDGVPYHARDMAVLYGSLGKFPVVLSSATPSLETLVNADRGRYGHVALKDRHGGRPELPAIDLIDMRAAKIEKGMWLSDALFGEVSQTLQRGEQALLFLNRRGYAPLTICRACGHRMDCPNCAASLVEHRFRKQLQCHHCGHAVPVPHACPSCKAADKLNPCGPGIERLAEEAARRFPDARLTILSSDLSRGQTLRDGLRSVERGESNLVIGTQLVAKGHHFPHLTLVGVVDADLALETGDPRGGERTWALMAQVAGRAGRGEIAGRALIQTYVPEHALMQALKRHDRDGYLAQEKKIREEVGLPPYGRLAAVIVSGSDAAGVERFARALMARAPLSEHIRVLGPAPAPIHLIRGRYRWRFLVKGGREQNLQAFLSSWLDGVKPQGSLKVAVDVDPYNFL